MFFISIAPASLIKLNSFLYNKAFLYALKVILFPFIKFFMMDV